MKNIRKRVLFAWQTGKKSAKEIGKKLKIQAKYIFLTFSNNLGWVCHLDTEEIRSARLSARHGQHTKNPQNALFKKGLRSRRFTLKKGTHIHTHHTYTCITHAHTIHTHHTYTCITHTHTHAHALHTHMHHTFTYTSITHSHSQHSLLQSRKER